MAFIGFFTTKSVFWQLLMFKSVITQGPVKTPLTTLEHLRIKIKSI